MLFARSMLLVIFCLLSFAVGATTTKPSLLKRGVPGKNRGDIIAPILDEQIASWCDFDKQIVVTKTNILCAYVGNKTTPQISATKLPLPPKLAVNKKSPPIPKDLTPNPYEMNEYGEEA